MRSESIAICFFLLGVGLGFMVGWTSGYGAAVDKCFDIGVRLLAEAGINLTDYGDKMDVLIRGYIHRLGL